MSTDFLKHTDDAAPYVDQLVRWRRYLHQYPEASFHEHETVKYIREQLTEFVPEAQLKNLTETSLVAVLDTGRPGPKVGLRADIDGLIMQENRPDLEFASKVENRMHGCGHDGHAATMMSALRWVSDHLDELTGTIVGIFQHAEETPPGGAIEMVETGYFDDFDFIYGFHYWATLPVGTIDIKAGPASANSDLWTLRFNGVGAHASTPDLAVDPVMAAAQSVQSTMTIAARQVYAIDPVVVSTTYMKAGDQASLNVIPPQAEIGGVVRTHTEEIRERAVNQLRNIAAAAEASNPGMSVELDYLRGYDMVNNNPGMVGKLRELLTKNWEKYIVTEPPMLGGEDFAAFSHRVPSVYLFIGAGNAEKGFDAPHHSPEFGLDEDAFPLALQIAVEAVRNAPDIIAAAE